MSEDVFLQPPFSVHILLGTETPYPNRDLPETLGSLSAIDLSYPNKERWIRFENGRVNEPLDYEVTKKHHSKFSELLHDKELSYRYEQVSQNTEKYLVK